MISGQPQVCILLSTYNGEPYLAEQLDSLWQQSYPNWVVWIRDDGSTDATWEILITYQTRDSRFQVLPKDEHHLGAAASFGYLLSRYSTSPYILFCDQDDWWVPHKIETMLQAMVKAEQQHPGPRLIHSDLAVTDHQLSIIAPSFWHYQGLDPSKNQLSRLLVQNTVTGCATMINQALSQQVTLIPPGVIMHDWWLALVASALGHIQVLDQSLVLYRQHGHNTIGVQPLSVASIMAERFQLIQRVRHNLIKTTTQAHQFLTLYGSDLNVEQYQVVNAFAEMAHKSYWGKRQTLFTYHLFKHGLLRNLLWTLLI